MADEVNPYDLPLKDRKFSQDIIGEVDALDAESEKMADDIDARDGVFRETDSSYRNYNRANRMWAKARFMGHMLDQYNATCDKLLLQIDRTFKAANLLEEQLAAQRKAATAAEAELKRLRAAEAQQTADLRHDAASRHAYRQMLIAYQRADVAPETRAARDAYFGSLSAVLARKEASFAELQKMTARKGFPA